MMFNKDYKEFRLDNGLLVALKYIPSLTVSGQLHVGYGTGHEVEGEEGIAHFLEHGIMHGGGQIYSGKRLDWVRRKFGDYNGHTGWKQTEFPIALLSENIEYSLDYLSDMVFNPRLDAESVELERIIVLRERTDRMSVPGFNDSQDLARAFWGEGPFTYFKLGSKESLMRTTPEDLRAFHAKGYGASNMELILVGDLPENSEDLVRRYFEDKPTGIPTPLDYPEFMPLEGKEILLRSAPERRNPENPEEGTAEFILALSAVPNAHEDGPALSILAYILGGNIGSRLFKRVREDEGLAYRIESNYDGSANAGVFEVKAFISPGRWQDVLQATQDEFQTLQKELVSDTELGQLKDIKRYLRAKALESHEGQLLAITAGLKGEPRPGPWLEQISKVTPEKIREVANRYLSDEKYVLLVREPLIE